MTSRALINGEPTESTLALGTKGAMRVIVRTTGEAAHSAYPHLGRSATRDLVRLLAELDALELPRDELLGETTVNIGSLSGGVADNVVAPWAEARLMVASRDAGGRGVAIVERWADGPRDARAGHRGAAGAPRRRSPGFETSVVAFATDIPELTNWGTPYLFGPGSIHVAHRDDEHVRIAELQAAVDAYERIVLADAQMTRDKRSSRQLPSGRRCVRNRSRREPLGRRRLRWGRGCSVRQARRR